MKEQSKSYKESAKLIRGVLSKEKRLKRELDEIQKLKLEFILNKLGGNNE